MTQVEDSFSSWQNANVKTFVVSPPSEGKVRSLQDVISHAPPYSRIELKSGTYPEQLTITKPVEIVAPLSESPEIAARSPCISITSNVECYFEGLTFFAKQVIVKNKDKELPAVLISAGSPIFVRCTISSMRVIGNGNPRVQECIIARAIAGCGLSLMDEASGQYENNDIRDHPSYCVEVHCTGRPVFRQNTIRSFANVEKVVIISSNSEECSPYFEENVIGVGPLSDEIKESTSDDLQNMNLPAETLYLESACILIVGKCSPRFVANRITRGKIGVTASKGTLAVFEGDRINHMTLWGIFATHNGCAQFVSVEVTKCAGGVRVDQCGANASFMECQLRDNLTHGMCVTNGADPTVRLCALNSNPKGGLQISQQSSGEFIDNTISRNEEYGVAVHGALAHPRFRGNRILCNKTGMVIARGAAPTLTECLISMNKKYGVFVSRAANPLFEQCTFSKSGGINIVFSERARGRLLRCDIVEGNEVGALVRDGANPHLEGCVFSKNRGGGACVVDGGIGWFVACEIGFMTRGFDVSNFGDPNVRQCKIRNCSDGGIVVHHEGLGTFVDNELTSSVVNVIVGQDSEPTFRRNNITNADTYGVHCMARSFPILESNIISNCGFANVMLMGEACMATLTKNRIENGRKFGIICCEGAGGLVYRNRTSGNQDGALCSSTLGEAKFVQNDCVDEKGPAIYCFDGGKGTFERNTISKGGAVGALIGAASPTILNCGFRESTVGVQIGNDAAGVVRMCEFEMNDIGLNVTAHASTVIEKCIFSKAKSVAVRYMEGSASRLFNCEIRESVIGVLSDCATPTVESVRFHDNLTSIKCTRSGSGVFRDCTLLSAVERHVWMTSGGNGTLINCTIRNAPVGTLCDDASNGLLKQCLVSECETGLHVLHAGELKAVETEVTDCRVGLWIRDGGLGDFSKCVYCKCSEVGVLLEHGAKPTMTECNCNLNSIGVHVRHGGQGHFLQSIFENNNDVGALIESGGHPTFTQCHFVSNVGDGVNVLEEGQGSFQGCLFKDGHRAGLRAMFTTALSVSDSEFTLNNDSGLVCLERASGIVKRCRFFKNSPFNISILPTAAPDIIENEISLGASEGVHLDSCGGTLVGNTIFMHNIAGVGVEGDVTTQITANQFRDNTANIVFAPRSSCTTVQENVFEASIQGVVVQKSARPELRNNTFGVGPIGVTLRLDAAGLISENTFTECNVGIYTEAETVTTAISHNKFVRNVKCGIDIRQSDSTLVVDHNWFEENDVGVLCTSNTSVTLRSNQFSRETTAAVFVEGASPRGEGNRFDRCGCGVFMCGGSCEPLFTEPENVFYCNQIGVHATKNAKGKFERCVFEKSSFAGVCVETGSEVEIASCLVSDHLAETSVGVAVDLGGNPNIHHSDFHNNTIALCVKGRSSGTVRENVFHDNSQYGIVVTDNSTPEIESNCCATNGTACLSISENASPVILKNKFVYSHCGVELTSSSASKIICDNLFLGCKVGALVTTVLPGLVLDANVFNECVNGVCFHTNAVATLSNNLLENCTNAVEVSSFANPTISTNVMRGNLEGVTFCNNARGVLRQNLIENGRRCGVQVTGKSEVELDSNDVVDCGVGIGITGEYSCGTVHKNAVHKCKQGIILGKLTNIDVGPENLFFGGEIGVMIQVDSRCRFHDNTAFGNTKYAVWLQSEHAVVTGNSMLSAFETGAFENECPKSKLVTGNSMKNRYATTGIAHTCLELSADELSSSGKYKEWSQLIASVCRRGYSCCIVEDAQWESDARRLVSQSAESGTGRALGRAPSFLSTRTPLMARRKSLVNEESVTAEGGASFIREGEDGKDLDAAESERIPGQPGNGSGGGSSVMSPLHQRAAGSQLRAPTGDSTMSPATSVKDASTKTAASMYQRPGAMSPGKLASTTTVARQQQRQRRQVTRQTKSFASSQRGGPSASGRRPGYPSSQEVGDDGEPPFSPLSPFNTSGDVVLDRSRRYRRQRPGTSPAPTTKGSRITAFRAGDKASRHMNRVQTASMSPNRSLTLSQQNSRHAHTYIMGGVPLLGDGNEGSDYEESDEQYGMRLASEQRAWEEGPPSGFVGCPALATLIDLRESWVREDSTLDAISRVAQRLRRQQRHIPRPPAATSTVSAIHPRGVFGDAIFSTPPSSAHASRPQTGSHGRQVVGPLASNVLTRSTSPAKIKNTSETTTMLQTSPGAFPTPPSNRSPLSEYVQIRKMHPRHHDDDTSTVLFSRISGTSPRRRSARPSQSWQPQYVLCDEPPSHLNVVGVFYEAGAVSRFRPV